MSLRLYCGEYLVSPVPLHFGMNHCSHACVYCFANLNRRGRRMENNSLGLIHRWFAAEKGPLPYWFLKNGYPLLVSNDTDPFCKSNYESLSALVETAEACGFGICYQTKGGEEKAERLALEGRKTMMYVSLTSDNDDTLKIMEPGAPSYRHRIDFIGEAVRLGHFVVVGINPLVPFWWQDAAAALENLWKIGVRHLWVGNLHFSRFQVEAMSAGMRERHADLIKYGQLKLQPDQDIKDALFDYADSLGFSVFQNGVGSKLGFWQPYFDLGYSFFPTLDGLFFDLERVGGGKPIVFDFEAFDSWCGQCEAPGNLSIYRDFLQPYGRSLRNAGENMRCRSFRDVHELEWRLFDYPTRLRSDHLCVAVVDDGGERSRLVDDQGRDLLVYVPCGCIDPWFNAADAVYLYDLPK